jgi:hypothetical protein
MAFLQKARAQSVGLRKDQELELPSANHFKSASVSSELAQKLASGGYRRVAGNIFLCPSSKDFWNVRGGKIVRLLGVEVDNNESLMGAPSGNPASFLEDALADLTF